MEKEFIMEVVQNCPNPACRFYKAQLDLSQSHGKPTYIPELQAPGKFLSDNDLYVVLIPNIDASHRKGRSWTWNKFIELYDVRLIINE